jgi:hypothetical protein
MRPVRLDPALIARFPDLAGIADDLAAIGERYAAMHIEPIPKGHQDIRGISWRCKGIANANRLRAEELFRFAILAINEGAIITAFVLARALDETLAAIVGSRIKIERAIAAGDPTELVNTLNKLTCGSVWMSATRADHPQPFKVGKLIGETAKYLDRVVGAPADMPSEEFGRNYGFVSEIAHPSIGSFAAYQKLDGNVNLFDRALGLRFEPMLLLSSLRMSGHLILAEADRLSQIPDLPHGWPGK